MHIQSQQSIVSRSDSPPDNGAHIMLHHIQSQETLYNLQPSQNGMYTTSHTNHIHPNSDYAVDIDPQKQLASKINDGPPSFRSPFSGFTSAARSRHHNAPSMLTSPTSYRESSTFYPSAADMYPQQMTSPTHVHMQPFEPRGSFDFSGSQTVNGVPKASFNVVDHQFTNGHSSLLPPHKSQPHSQQSQLNGYGSQYMNGIHLSSQTPYGPPPYSIWSCYVLGQTGTLWAVRQDLRFYRAPEACSSTALVYPLVAPAARGHFNYLRRWFP